MLRIIGIDTANSKHPRPKSPKLTQAGLYGSI